MSINQGGGRTLKCNTTAEISPNRPTRRVYDGASVQNGYKVVSSKFVPFGKNHTMDIVKVSSEEEYSSGCSIHSGGCFGHMCNTPDGSLLLPQSMVVKVGKIVPQFLRVSGLAFDGNPEFYESEMMKTAFTKYGHLRAMMSTPVAGSARLVAVPQVSYHKHIVCISEELCSSIRYCNINAGEDGIPESKYSETTLKENDHCILLRPPSLTIRSVQPVTVKFWKHHCIGVHPELFAQQHGDYDGDEVHIYPLGTQESINEAKSWIHQSLNNFDNARSVVMDVLARETRGEVKKTLGNEDCQTEAGLNFMNYTTLSVDQIMKGDTDITLGNMTRNKHAHLAMMRERLLSKDAGRVFASESARGTADVTRQQLSQSTVGEMSRVARITASCFVRSNDGTLYCLTLTGPEKLNVEKRKDSGSPACRAVMSLCSVAQQSLLDAHRVGSRASSGFDMISDLIKGIDRLDSSNRKYETVCMFDASMVEIVKPLAVWCSSKDNVLVAIVAPEVLPPYVARSSIGTYSPIILRHIHERERFSVCERAIALILNYYSIDTACEEDMNDFISCMIYRPEVSNYPTTTREGSLARELTAVDALLATDYTKLPSLSDSESPAKTSTSCMFLGNFDELITKMDKL